MSRSPKTPIHRCFVTELAYQLLASLPRSRLATIQRRLAPLLQFDVVGVRALAILHSEFDFLRRCLSLYPPKFHCRYSRTCPTRRCLHAPWSVGGGSLSQTTKRFGSPYATNVVGSGVNRPEFTTSIQPHPLPGMTLMTRAWATLTKKRTQKKLQAPSYTTSKLRKKNLL